MADQEHREIWTAINDTKQELAEHTGACAVRHQEIIRRQDESIRDRHGMNLKLDALSTGLHKLEAKMMGVMLTVAGSALVIVVGIIAQLLIKR